MNRITMSKEQAEQHGFIIEGEVGFFYDLGCTTAMLGYDSMNEVWRFDVAVDQDGNTWSFTDTELTKALNRADALASMMQAWTKYQTLSGADEGLRSTYIEIMEYALEGTEEKDAEEKDTEGIYKLLKYKPISSYNNFNTYIKYDICNKINYKINLNYKISRK